MKKIRTILTSALIAFGLLVTPAVLNVVPAGAACGPNATAKECANTGANATTNCTSPDGCPSLGDRIKTVVNILLFVLGAIAVIMIVIGGIRYTISGGDSGAITGAKNTILYAVVGLVVALLAYAIVNFVLGAF